MANRNMVSGRLLIRVGMLEPITVIVELVSVTLVSYEY
jgi:hypothetical protein